ncbi:MAG: hypothetical protein WC652_04500 [archaeon]|jgi:hypothetical protein
MNFPAFSLSLFIGLAFLYLEVEWMGLLFIVISVLFFFYDPTKKYSKIAWEEMKKSDTFSPDAKIDAYTKGISKTIAENIVKTDETEVNVKGALHKTPQMAKNFFAELKEVLGMK